MFDIIDRPYTMSATHLDPLLGMQAVLAELAAEDRHGWTAGALSERVTELMDVRERLDAELLRLVAEWDRDRAWESDGSLSAGAWLEHRTPVSPREARRLVKHSRVVDRHQGLATALAQEKVTTGHVQAFAMVASDARQPVLAAHEPTLIDNAASLSIRDFTTVMRRWAALADDELAADNFDKKWERRHLHLSKTMDGWGHLDGFLDPAGYAALAAALDHLAPPDPVEAPDGPRTLSQRRADGLVDLATSYLNGAAPTGSPPNLNVVVDIATLTGKTPEAAVAQCDLEGVGPVTRQTMLQLACGAAVMRVVIAGASVVLDMGRRTRLATAPQRRAVSIRDRHCRFPGCDRLPRWCDVHHVDAWPDGGQTDVENLILLCRRHHTLIHQTRWVITAGPDGTYEFTQPARGP